MYAPAKPGVKLEIPARMLPQLRWDRPRPLGFGGSVMKPATRRSSWLAWDRIIPIGVVSLGLFGVSFFSDVYLEMRGVPLTATIINNVAIGLLGGAALPRTRSRCRAIKSSSEPRRGSRSSPS